MPRTAPRYLVTVSYWDGTEGIRSFERKEDANLHCATANAAGNAAFVYTLGARKLPKYRDHRAQAYGATVA